MIALKRSKKIVRVSTDRLQSDDLNISRVIATSDKYKNTMDGSQVDFE